MHCDCRAAYCPAAVMIKSFGIIIEFILANLTDGVLTSEYT